MPQSRGLYFRVGALVLAGLALTIGFVLFFTASRFGRGAVVYETYLRESVQGLDVGSAVRYRGVAIGRVSEIELTFVADGAGVNVVLEADRRGGIFGGGGDTYGRFTLSHVEAENHDWAGAIGAWLDLVAAGGGFGHSSHGHDGGHAPQQSRA